MTSDLPESFTVVRANGQRDVVHSAAVDGKRLTIVRLGRDRYGRTLGVVYADGENVACAQLEAGQAFYIERWDDDGLVAADCPDLAAARTV